MADESVIARGRVESIGTDRARVTLSRAGGEVSTEFVAIPDHRSALLRLLGALSESGVDAVGWKAVHGGPRFAGSVMVTDEVLAAMREFASVAPVHNPLYLEAMENLGSDLLGVPMVAVFETGFHSTIPEASSLYGIPYDWSETYGIRRYGFHGSSHRYVSQQLPLLLGRSARDLRIVSCHLGGSSSVCAVRGGTSVDTSFGFSPQSGLEQTTRCGDLDPFAVLYLLERAGLTATELAHHLCTRSGLLGISGVSGDLREIEEAAAAGNRRASLAVDVLVTEVKRWIGASAAVMDGLDALVFTGGIGENSWSLRQRICSGLQFLGVELDLDRNRELEASGGILSPPRSAVCVAVIPANEELMVARETVHVLQASGAGGPVDPPGTSAAGCASGCGPAAAVGVS
jgi:acetate kinase